MSAQPTSTKTEHAQDPQGDDAAYYRQVLHCLIDIGADLARLVHAQAVAQPDEAAVAASAAAAFDRVARAVRRTVALARKLHQPPPVNRFAARKRIIRQVEDAIHREPGDHETLRAELIDRLEGPDLDDDIDHRPVDAIIDDILCDLGIATLGGWHLWKRRTPADIAALCALARTGRDPPPAILGRETIPRETVIRPDPALHSRPCRTPISSISESIPPIR